MIKKSLFIGKALLFVVACQAQITSDALLFSDLQPMVTARSLAVGNALGAMGGDISCLSMNPAGIAIYRNSEIVLTPGIGLGATRTTFGDTTVKAGRTSAHLNNVGIVFAQTMDKPKWYGMGLGVSLNRVASFNQSYTLNNVSNGSRITTWTNNAQGTSVDNLNPFEEQLAYYAYLIDNPNAPTAYVGALTDSNYVRKKQYVKQSGGINELALSFGMNYKNKLYWGFGIGINFLAFRETKVYSETEETGTISFKSMEFTEKRRVNGVGLNARLGVIYRVNHLLRVGVSAQVPTGYNNTERYSTGLKGDVIYNGAPQKEDLLSQEGRYPHQLTTPWIVTGSVGLILGKKSKPKIGFVSVDADYLSYNTATFALKGNNNDPSNEAYIENLNGNLDELLRAAFRIRAGAEFVADIFRIRAGYRFQSSPYQTPVAGVSDLRHDISMGVGIRQKHFFIDLTYCHTLRDFEYIPYFSPTIVQQSIVKFSGGNILLTAGVRFGQKLE